MSRSSTSNSLHFLDHCTSVQFVAYFNGIDNHRIVGVIVVKGGEDSVQTFIAKYTISTISCYGLIVPRVACISTGQPWIRMHTS